MEITKSELAKILEITEDQLSLNNGLWDVYRGIIISPILVKNGKLTVSFGKIDGYFWCNELKLTSLIGCPHTVNLSFFCCNNNLTSLEYCPQIINGSFNCSINKIISLDGCPQTINGTFDCSDNKLTFIKNIKAYYYTLHNNKITYISDDIDISDISLYKNPYNYFKKFNYNYI